MKCNDCRYVLSGEYHARGKEPRIEYVCTLTRVLVSADKDHDCQCHNRDLSEYDICYNCKYYMGGGDWGLFCSHEDMYHHLGKFNDDACERFERKMRGGQDG